MSESEGVGVPSGLARAERGPSADPALEYIGPRETGGQRRLAIRGDGPRRRKRLPDGGGRATMPRMHGLRFAPWALLAVASCHSPSAPAAPTPGAPAGDDAAALRRLDALAGSWESESRALHVPSGTLYDASARSEATWVLGGRFLLVESRSLTSEGDAPPSSLALFTWDPEAGLYRSWTFHSSGEVAAGTMSFDEPTSTWSMAERWRDPWSGDLGEGRGSMTFDAADHKVLLWERGSAAAEEASYRVRGESRRLPDTEQEPPRDGEAVDDGG